ncbi:DISARM system phospholipase D-like protein DrmC [Streptomyces sp. NPDC021093]|uniref:DISARM system phospholipase D-like protein DrmC n=1 Tax=Streptomyces sp. NPDC021093 TaxID=3365112 RepID=UPI0037A78155
MTDREQAFRQAAADAQTAVGAESVRTIAEGIAQGRSRVSMLTLRTQPGFAEAATRILDGMAVEGVPDAEASAYLRGLADGYALRADEQEVSLVWSGPSSHRVPVRSTSRVLIQLVEEARQELLLMTYSATRYLPLEEALQAAVGRGVVVDVVVETLQGAGSALTGTEPASAFARVEGARIWHWPPDRRSEPGAKAHAKLAVADRRALLTTSANFTQSGVGKNMEAGILIRGGPAPVRAAEHIQELQRTDVLRRYW